MSSQSQDSLARAIGWILRKWYDDLISTISGTSNKKKNKKMPPQQIPTSLSKWEDSVSHKKKKPDVLD